MSASTIGPYRVIRELGQGGMGTVVLAEDTRLGRQVALKTVSGAQAGTSGGRAQLLDEARAAAAISHPAIAAVHDVIEQDGDIAIVFELVEGETLAARLKKGPLSQDQALDIGLQIADALNVAHGHGVLHRDLKPSNIMLAAGDVVKILDFGIARFQPRGRTRGRGDRAEVPAGADPAARDRGTPETDVFQGTPGYVAPEQWTGKGPVDERADLYALGVVLFEMLTGKRPFAERDPFTLARASTDRIARRVSSLRPDVAPALDKLVSRLLATDPSLRPPRARVVADEIRSLRAPAPPPPVPWRRYLAIAALVVAAIGGLGWWATRPVVLDVTNPVIAVLPFANETGDSGNDYLAAGVADSLATSLASLPTVSIVSRATVDDARTRRTAPGEIAADLGATFVVDGRMQAAGAQTRVTIALRRPDGSSPWSEDVEGPASGMFGLQARLATAVAAALQLQVSPELQERLARRPTTKDEALEAYWRGRSYLERRDTPGNLTRAEAAFSEALRLDPRFMQAQAALGETYWRLYDASRDQVWASKAVDSSRNAVTLAPDDVAAKIALGITLQNTGRSSEAVEELQRALVIRSNDDEARRHLARALAALGRLDEGLAEWRKALAARPNNWQILSDMGLALFRAGRYDEAAQACTELTRLQPDNPIGYSMLGSIYQDQGLSGQALEVYEKALKLAPSATVLSNIGAIHHEQGEFDRAVDAYGKALALRANMAPIHRNLGDSLLRLGRTRDAQAAYERAVALAEAVRVVNPKDAINLASLAVYLEKAGEDEQARLRLREATSLAPGSSQVWSRAAQVHALAGRRDEAVAALAEAIACGYVPSEANKVDEFAALNSYPPFKALITGNSPALRR